MRSQVLLKRGDIAGVQRATLRRSRRTRRMGARELALRFIALRLDRDLREYEGRDGGRLPHRLHTSHRRSQRSQTHLQSLEEQFTAAMDAAHLFGDHAFRKWPKGSEYRSPVNRALFESWSTVLADYELRTLAEHKAQIIEATRAAFSTNRSTCRRSRQRRIWRAYACASKSPRISSRRPARDLAWPSDRNFKRFLSLDLEMRALTVLTGINGGGKTSVLHALLLARQASSGSPPPDFVQLNGPFGLQLGGARRIPSRLEHRTKGSRSR